MRCWGPKTPKLWPGFYELVVYAIIGSLLLFTFSGTAQPNTDKPHRFSSQKILMDTAAILKQLQLADDILETQQDTSLLLVNDAIESSRRLGFWYGIAFGLHQAGLLHTQKSNYRASVAAFRQALPYCDRVTTNKSANLKVSVLSNLASSYSYLGKADSTAWYCYQALQETERLKIETPSVLLHVYAKILRLWLSLNDDNRSLATDKYMQYAINYLNKAEALGHADKAMTAKIFFSKGQLKEIGRDYDSARYFYQLYLQLLHQGGVRKGRSISWNTAMLLNISNTFNMQNRPDSAIWYAHKAVQDLPNTEAGSNAQYQVTSAYFVGKALCLQKKYTEAINITLPALQKARQKEIYLLRQLPHEILAEAYQNTGDYKSALQHQKAYAAIKDSLTQTGKMQAITQMEMRYQVAEKNKELAEKELAIVKKDDSIRNKNLLLAGISTGLLLLLLAGILFYNRNKHRQQLASIKAEQQLQIASLQATIDGEENERRRLARELHDGVGGQLGSLRLQLDTALRDNGIDAGNPHFETVISQINNTYTDLRQTAHNLMPETLVHEGLAKAAEIFCAGLARGASFSLDFETLGNIPRLPAHTELALYRMLQELLHNVVKHAHASQVLVQLAFANNMLVITIEDDGRGFDISASKSEGKGLGLAAIQHRVKAMGGSMDIFSEPERGTSINIELYTGSKTTG